MTAAPLPTGRRAGFTLVELLVAMTVIVVLAAIAIAVVPGAMENDRTTDAAATIRQHLMIAKARATRESNGRGIRFIVTTDPNTPAKTNAAWSTEMQYIESAPTIVPNPFGLTQPTVGATVGDPFVEFDYTDPNNPVCRMKNVELGGRASEVLTVIENDLGANWFPKLYCPVLGPDAFGRTQRFEVIDINPRPSKAAAGTRDWTLSLFNYPTTLMGSGQTQRVYRFAIEPRSRPLLGEPNVTLPKNVCVDLEASVPSVRVVTLPNGTTVQTDYEVMFAPNGQVLDPDSSGQIYLWVRDYTKYATNPARVVTPGPPPTYDVAAFQQGGEQQLVAIKAKTGALGVFPVMWPDAGTGQYGVRAPGPPATYFSPYFLAEKEAMSP
jgi:prepilin-type N-terminal cleavage/methylation domain-containing protein